MSTMIKEKILIRDIFADTPLDNKEMYQKALEDVLIDLGVAGIEATPTVKYPLIYLKDYLYSRLYSKLASLGSLDYLRVIHLEFNFLEIHIIGRPND